MNANQAKKVPLYDLLAQLGHHAVDVKHNGNEVWYRSPFRPQEKTASFKIKLSDNVWYDFGEGAGGNVLDFVMKHQHTDFKGALAFLERTPTKAAGQFRHISAIPDLFIRPKKEKEPEVIDVKPVYHYALKEYLKERGLAVEMAVRYLREVVYKVQDKEYFALGFANRAGGFELRSSVFKGGIGEKDISVIENGSNKICAFEGFMDFLSYLTLNPANEKKNDYLILNSTAMKGKGAKFILSKGYEFIDTYFDNDTGGIKTNEYFRESILNVAVCAKNELYAGHKDLNEFICPKSRAVKV
jgi:hypothetical protein